MGELVCVARFVSDRHKGELPSLKRHRRVAFFPNTNLLISKEFPKPEFENEPRTLAEHLLRCRKRRGLLQREVAAIMGVCAQSVIEWEGGKAPSICMWPKVIAFLGLDPSAPPATLGQRIKAARRRLGLPLKGMAERLGCYEETVGYWEADARRPTESNRELLERLLSSCGLSRAAPADARPEHQDVCDLQLRPSPSTRRSYRARS